jgi:hypothetical protein
MLRGELVGFKVGGKLRVRESDYERWAYAQPITPAARVERSEPARARRSQPVSRGSVAALEEIERRLSAG